MSFADELADNTRQAMVAALLRTVVSNPKRTIGDVLKALEKEKDGAYLPDMFRGVTILQLVQAAAERIRETGVGLDGGEPDDMPPAEASGSAGDGGASVSNPPNDPDEDPDAGPEDDLEDEPNDDPEEGGRVRAPKKRKKDKKGKGKKDKKDKKGKKSKGKKDKGEKEDKDEGAKGKSDGHLNLVDPNDQKAYQSEIVKYLRKSKCIDFESGKSSTQIRKVVGGDPKQFRDNIDPLVKSDRVGKGGEARGVRYFVG
jgi:hypothetical protein